MPGYFRMINVKQANPALRGVISMTMKRVLVIESGLFVGGVINELLKSRCADLEVQSISPSGVSDMCRVIALFNPEVIITDDTSPDELLKAILLYSLRFPNLRVVVICADANRLQIYNTQRVEVGHMEDFLAVI